MITLIQSIPLGIIIVIIFLLSFMTTYLSVPRVIYVAKKKGLVANPNNRSSHKESTPTIGGVSFFLSLMVSLFVLSKFHNDSHISMSIATGLTILFFIGLKDDIVALRPRTKMISQFIAAIVILSNERLMPMTFDGFLGINLLPWWLAMLFGVFVILSIVNSYNLIDGINGSASMVGVVIFAVFAYLFFSAGEVYYGLLSVAGIGFLLAFLRYNLAKKIFMGDTGSMIVGFVLGVLTLRLFSCNTDCLQNMSINPINKFIIAISILFIPFVDTARVFLIRLVKHGKPFSPDRNHVHHVIIDFMHLSHCQASLLLAFINTTAFITILVADRFLEIEQMLLLLSFMVLSFAGALFYFNRSFAARKKKQKIRKALQKTKENNFYLF